MRKITLPSTAILGAMLALSLHVAPAQAQINRTWVASNGTNNATCDRTTPCATFQQAHDATTFGGEINCVDAGDYGQVSIIKSISIVCDNTQAGILVTSGFGITVGAGEFGIVTLKGLDIEGLGTGLAGIAFVSGAALHVHKVQIRNFRANANGVSGLFFSPSSYAELYVADSYITDNGLASQPVNGGIVIRPTGSGSANVSINRVRLENNSTGISVDGTGSTGVAVNAVVLDSMVAGSAGNGIAAVATSGNAAVSALLDHSVVSGNFSSGINANGAAASGAGSAVVRIGDSTIALNFTGVSTTNSGVVQSFKNNRISGNLTNGIPIPAVALE